MLNFKSLGEGIKAAFKDMKTKDQHKHVKRLNATEKRRVRSKLKAAAYGEHGVDWKKLFSQYDRDNGGVLEYPEFKRALRSDAKISVSMLSDAHVQHLFNTIDVERDDRQADKVSGFAPQTKSMGALALICAAVSF